MDKGLEKWLKSVHFDSVRSQKSLEKGSSNSTTNTESGVKSGADGDDITANMLYFAGLLKAFQRNSASKQVKVPLAETEAEWQVGGFFPIGAQLQRGSTLADWQKAFPLKIQNFRDLKNNSDFLSLSEHTTVRIQKLQAGTGTSVERVRYLARELGIEEKEVVLGAKGTDLFVSVEQERFSVCELQWLQAMVQANRREFKKIVIQDLVGLETKRAILEKWKRQIIFPSVFKKLKQQGTSLEKEEHSPSSGTDLKISYAEWTNHADRFQRLEEVLQLPMPTIVPKTAKRDWGPQEISRIFPLGPDSEWVLTTDRMAPAGHGFFAFHAVRSALNESRQMGLEGAPLGNRSTSSVNRIGDQAPQVLVMGNGEDLNSSPQPEVVGWMVKHKIPLCMVTTDRTEIDKKGGLFGFLKKKTKAGEMAIPILYELAQAKTAGDEKKFERIGLGSSSPECPALFNTNMVYVNWTEFVVIIQQLSNKMGEEKLLEAILPDLLLNRKTQNGTEFIQLEGAMGSSILKIDHLTRESLGTQSVALLRVEASLRSEVFCPIKTAFDFVLQFFSNRFQLDLERFRLKDNNPGPPPQVNLPSFYSDVENLLEDFRGIQMKHLRALKIEGPAESVDITTLRKKIKKTLTDHHGNLEGSVSIQL